MPIGNAKARDELGSGLEPAAAVPEPTVRMRLLAVLRGHSSFCAALAAAVAVRAVAMLGYPPAMFFNDSLSYLTDMMTGQPDSKRGNGYAFFLELLRPLHSFEVVTGLQALLGLVMGAAIYAVLRRRGLPGWGATLCTLPVLFDVYEIEIEHTISSDLLFIALVTVAVALLCFWDRPPWVAVIAAGLLTGCASTVRDVGEPLLVLFVVSMIARRMGWRRIVATAAAGLLPIAAYMLWFHSATGQYAMNDAGAFLYGRVQSFAECSKMNPPADLRALCDPRPPSQRGDPSHYVWAPDQPLMKLSGGVNLNEFTPAHSKMSTKFAELAIESQPLDYAGSVVSQTLTTFDWNRVNANNAEGNRMGTGPLFQFSKTPFGLSPGTRPSSVDARAARAFSDSNPGLTQVRRPWAPFLWLYEHVYLRGTMLLVIMLIGLSGIVAEMRRKAWRERRWGGLALLPWLVGAALIILPPMTAGFSYRYVLAGVPVLCLAAGLTFAARDSQRAWRPLRAYRGLLPPRIRRKWALK